MSKVARPSRQVRGGGILIRERKTDMRQNSKAKQGPRDGFMQ